ncbi:MAG TPA: hypothetical protein VH916_05090 [Dehalococcoidia bacterium]|jgi:hypothetical protein
MRSTATDQTQSVRNSRKLLLGVGTGALLAICAVAGIAALHTSRTRRSPSTARSVAPLPDTAGGNLSQSATRGGMADSRQLQPVAREAADGLPQRPMGGYAEWLLLRDDAAALPRQK